jgi:hypothetical protein
VEIAIHEGLHQLFPDFTEDQVTDSAEKLAQLVVGVLEAKGVVLPALKPLLTRENAEEFFPGAEWRGEDKAQ